MNKTTFAALSVLLWAILFSIAIYKIYLHNNGHIIYTLDDPYIHLALANNIIQGNYGINLTEYSSPSSSIIYPFLSAFGLLIGLGEYSPLVFNTIAQILIIILISGFFWDRIAKNLSYIWAILGSLSIILSINSIGLPLTGLEQVFHVLLTTCVFWVLFNYMKKEICLGGIS